MSDKLIADEKNKDKKAKAKAPADDQIVLRANIHITDTPNERVRLLGNANQKAIQKAERIANGTDNTRTRVVKNFQGKDPYPPYYPPKGTKLDLFGRIAKRFTIEIEWKERIDGKIQCFTSSLDVGPTYDYTDNWDGEIIPYLSAKLAYGLSKVMAMRLANPKKYTRIQKKEAGKIIYAIDKFTSEYMQLGGGITAIAKKSFKEYWGNKEATEVLHNWCFFTRPMQFTRVLNMYTQRKVTSIVGANRQQYKFMEKTEFPKVKKVLEAVFEEGRSNKDYIKKSFKITNWKAIAKQFGEENFKAPSDYALEPRPFSSSIGLSGDDAGAFLRPAYPVERVAAYKKKILMTGGMVELFSPGTTKGITPCAQVERTTVPSYQQQEKNSNVEYGELIAFGLSAFSKKQKHVCYDLVVYALNIYGAKETAKHYITSHYGDSLVLSTAKSHTYTNAPKYDFTGEVTKIQCLHCTRYEFIDGGWVKIEHSEDTTRVIK